MPSDNVREVQQARASSTTLATLTGKAGQLIVNKSDWRVHVMDGTTAGGRPVAMKPEVDSKANDSVVVKQTAQTLSETVQTQVLTNLGVISAIEELITEYGGTVPTSLSSQSATTMAAGSDPWGDFN